MDVFCDVCGMCSVCVWAVILIRWVRVIDLLGMFQGCFATVLGMFVGCVGGDGEECFRTVFDQFY